jgi:glycosyltransferase involved in cell wall biosynthesis
MRVQIVDPSAYTPPYDDALCRALAAADVDVELVTSHFAYGTVPPPRGYARREHFYRLAHRAAAGGPRSRARLALKAAEHVPDMLRYRRAARAADVVHFQWLTMQPLDVHLLPPRRPPGARPKRVLTAHDVLPREPRAGQLSAQRRLYERMDAVVAHTEHGRRRLCDELGLAAELVHVIPHGMLRPWEGSPERALPDEFQRATGPVALFLGLLRPYKGLDVLLDAWRSTAGVELGAAAAGAELWIVGMPRMDVAPLRAAAAAAERAGAGRVRFLARFVPDAETHAFMRRASLVVAPYREIEQSGVAFTALGAGTPLLLSDAGGFPELAATGAARTVPAGDADALAAGLLQLLGDPALRDEMAAHAGEAAAGPYAWGTIAAAHRRLYERLLAR